MGQRRLEINATLTHISYHLPKLEIHTSFLGARTLVSARHRGDVGSLDRHSVSVQACALYAAVPTGGKVRMMEGGLRRENADL